MILKDILDFYSLNNKYEVLNLAIKKNNLKDVKILLNEIEFKNDQGLNYLLCSIKAEIDDEYIDNNIEIIKNLLTKGIDNINKKDIFYYLSEIENKKRLKEIFLLLKDKINIDNNALIYLIKKDKIVFIDLLFEKNIKEIFSIIPINIKGESLIYITCTFNSYKILQYLFQKIDDLYLFNFCDLNGVSPLMIACISKARECIHILLEYKDLDLNHRDKNGLNALFYALKEEGIFLKLLKKGIYINNQDKNGSSILMFVIVLQSKKLIQYLIQYKINLNLQDKNDETALIKACDTKNRYIIKTLIEAGADLNLIDKQGWSPLMYCARWGLSDIILLLINKKVDFKLKSKSPWHVYDKNMDALDIALISNFSNKYTIFLLDSLFE